MSIDLTCGVEMGTFVVRAEIYPTEDEEKIRTAIHSIFPAAELRTEGNIIEGEVRDLHTLIEIVIDQNIRYSFIEEIGRNSTNSGFSIMLNKQAAFAGKVNTVDEPKPLGEILFTGNIDNPLLYFEKLLGIQGYLSGKERPFNPPDPRYEGGIN
jgi:predicted RNA binding protein with dsRBD fold (UPF0201 family)